MNNHHNDKLSIVFDFGEVLLYWNPRFLYRRFFNGDEAAMERFLEEINFHEWNMMQDAGRPFAEGVAELTARFPHYAELIQAYDTCWEETVPGPVTGNVEILRTLKKAGYPIHGLSNWSTEKFYSVRAKYDFFDLIDPIVLSGEEGIAKPDPRIFQLLLDRIGRPAGECLLIDDSQKNIQVARELGFRAIRFQDSGQLTRELKEMGIL